MTISKERLSILEGQLVSAKAMFAAYDVCLQIANSGMVEGSCTYELYKRIKEKMDNKRREINLIHKEIKNAL